MWRHHLGKHAGLAAPHRFATRRAQRIAEDAAGICLARTAFTAGHFAIAVAHPVPRAAVFAVEWGGLLYVTAMIQIFDRRGFTLLLTIECETLQGAQLAGAQLNDANLVQVDLSGADLSGAALRDADLRLARLDNANFNGADLNGADLSRAKLTGANLMGARLLGTKLSGADLRGALVERKALMMADAREALTEGANIL